VADGRVKPSRAGSRRFDPDLDPARQHIAGRAAGLPQLAWQVRGSWYWTSYTSSKAVELSAVSRAFSQAAQWTARQCGKPHTFVGACLIIAIWGASGPIFGYSDTWQLIINTGTTIVTFLMVFLMQNTQNRDTASIQIKLDELIRANANARNAMLSLEDLTEDQLIRLKATFAQLAGVQGGDQHKLQEVRKELEGVGEKVDAASESVEQAQEKILDAAERRRITTKGTRSDPISP
jgi:low affinity Fe/Cu permease